MFNFLSRKPAPVQNTTVTAFGKTVQIGHLAVGAVGTFAGVQLVRAGLSWRRNKAEALAAEAKDTAAQALTDRLDLAVSAVGDIRSQIEAEALATRTAVREVGDAIAKGEKTRDQQALSARTELAGLRSVVEAQLNNVGRILTDVKGHLSRLQIDALAGVEDHPATDIVTRPSSGKAKASA